MKTKKTLSFRSWHAAALVLSSAVHHRPVLLKRESVRRAVVRLSSAHLAGGEEHHCAKIQNECDKKRKPAEHAPD